VAADLWSVEMVFHAHLREPGSTPEAPRLRTVELIRYASDTPTVSEKGFLLDVVQEAGGAEGRLTRSMLTILDGREVTGQLGVAVPTGDLERISVEVTLRDPLKVHPLREEMVLWGREKQPASFRNLRALISGDNGAHTLNHLAPRLATALTSRLPAEGGYALLARADLASMRRHAVLGPVALAEPVLVVTTLVEENDGTYHTYTDTILPAGPALYDANQRRVDGLGWPALAEVHARNEALPQSVRWATDVASLLTLPFSEERIQVRARRDVEAGLWVGVDDGGRVWRYHPVTGGAAMYGADTALKAAAGPPVERIQDAHQHWKDIALCLLVADIKRDSPELIAAGATFEACP
jgi:hypothetical protein